MIEGWVIEVLLYIIARFKYDILCVGYTLILAYYVYSLILVQ